MPYITYIAVGLLAGILVILFIDLITSIRKNRRRRSGKQDKRKLEFAKFIVALYAFACIAWIQQDFILAFKYGNPINTEVTKTLTETVVKAILGYYAKSLLEKMNRNKYGLDENGNPFDFNNEGE